MKRMTPSIVPWLFLALAVLFSCSTGEQAGTGPRRSLKGFEIYSWQEKGEWCFSLHTGTNRMKTFEEVTAEETALHGFEALKEQLGGLAKDEFVTWSPAAFPRADHACRRPGRRDQGPLRDERPEGALLGGGTPA